MPKNPIPNNAKRVFKGVIFDVYQWEQKMYDGSKRTFEVLKRPNSIQVIATVNDKILIQIQKQPLQPSFISVPGGRQDEGEGSLQAAKRELLEETGYLSKNWSLWQKFQPHAKIIFNVYTFIARGCVLKQKPHLDGGEKIKNKLITFDEFLKLSDNKLLDVKGLREPLLRARLNKKEKEKLHKQIFG